MVALTAGLAAPALAVTPNDSGGSGTAPTTANCKPTFFGLKTWSYYLKKDGNCNISEFEIFPKDRQSDIILIVLAIIDDLLVVAGYVAVIFIIGAGVMYITSQGAPDQTQKAQQAIQNALIGLLIAILAIAVVRFIGGKLT